MREKGLPSVNPLKTCLVILTFFHIVSAQTAKETVDKCVALLISRSYQKRSIFCGQKWLRWPHNWLATSLLV